MFAHLFYLGHTIPTVNWSYCCLNWPTARQDSRLKTDGAIKKIKIVHLLNRKNDKDETTCQIGFRFSVDLVNLTRIFTMRFDTVFTRVYAMIKTLAHKSHDCEIKLVNGKTVERVNVGLKKKQIIRHGCLRFSLAILCALNNFYFKLPFFQVCLWNSIRYEYRQNFKLRKIKEI